MRKGENAILVDFGLEEAVCVVVGDMFRFGIRKYMIDKSQSTFLKSW